MLAHVKLLQSISCRIDGYQPLSEGCGKDKHNDESRNYLF
jgi:hypothetical protein